MGNPKKSDSIALVEWNWTGHHPSYFVFFATVLLNQGWNVVGLCPEPDEASELLQHHMASHGAGDWEDRMFLAPIHKNRYRLSNRAGTLIAPVSRADWTLRTFLGVEAKIRKVARVNKQTVRGIFYACIYDIDFKDICWVDHLLRYPWVGLYVHAKSIRIPRPTGAHPQNHPLPERLFAGRRCKAIGMLDEGITDQVASRIEKPVVVFPDVTDADLGDPHVQSRLDADLKEFAAGRNIIGLFGHLNRSKGILDLLDAAQLPELQNVCFAFGGQLGVKGYTEAEFARIESAFNEWPNVWAHPTRITSEHEMNRLIDACDIIAACYTDFPHSSNILSKAAFLKKPVIVNDGYLMAERVRKYALGEVIPQGDLSALEKAIRILTHGAPDREFKWDLYADAHSLERFENAVHSLVGHISVP